MLNAKLDCDVANQIVELRAMVEWNYQTVALKRKVNQTTPKLPGICSLRQSKYKSYISYVIFVTMFSCA